MTDDERLNVKLDMPPELGGRGGEGTNPEQLFACGYAACFESAVRLCAHRSKLRIGELSITATVAIHTDAADDGFALSVELTGQSSKLSPAELGSLMQEAHAICPYSKATRGNISVDLRPTGDTKPSAA